MKRDLSCNRSRSLRWFAFSASLGPWALGCGSPTSLLNQFNLTSAPCGPQEAQVLVGDGFFKVTCGCTVPSENNKIYGPSEALVCHLPSSEAKVFFFTFGARLAHQVVPTGSSRFAPSPIFMPTEGQPAPSFAVSFPEGGRTYDFQDAYTGMTGQFIVP
ncbi:MAG: hypothetical protein ACO3A2_01375 [Bdellovibrionia bacterium]